MSSNNNRTRCLINNNHKFKAKANGSASTATFTTLTDRMSLAGIATSEIEKCLILLKTTNNSNNRYKHSKTNGNV